MTREFLLIADVGDDVYHVGDEAVFEVALAEIAARCDASITVVASNPAVVAARYGVNAVPQVGFDQRVGSAFDPGREQRLQAVLDGTAADPAAVSVRRAVAAADGVLVCGGSNLSASWPHLLYERLVLLALAAQQGVPTVLVAQTIGPELTGRPAGRLAETLAAAAFVGVRDVPSAALARQLAPTASVLHHLDDAVLMSEAEPPAGLPDEYVAFAMHGNVADDHFIEQCVAMIGHLHDRTRLPVVLVPHTGGLGPDLVPGTDAELVVTLAKGHPDATWLHALPTQTTTQTAAVLRHAKAVVGARHHPLVLGLSAGVPSLGLTTDRYTDVKVAGALEHHGMAAWRLPLHMLGTGMAEDLFDELWVRRDEIRAHLVQGSAAHRRRHTARWDHVVRCLTGESPRLSDLEDAPVCPALTPTTVPTRVALAWDEHAQALVRELWQRADRSEEYALSLRDALDREIDERTRERLALERSQALLQAELAIAREEVGHAQLSAAAARDLAGRLRASLDLGPTPALRSRDIAALQHELDALHQTKLFRWTAPARRLYARLRR